MNDPRNKYLDAALPLFAMRGLHGTSISQISQTLGLSKQAILHHFASKDGLYRAVLDRVAPQYLSLLDSKDITDQPANQRLKYALDRVRAAQRRDPHAGRLLLRTLIDDTPHGALADTCLRQVLDRLTTLAQSAPHWRGAPERDARAGVLFLLGALYHLTLSAPALARIYGEDVPGDAERYFLRQIDDLIASPRL